MGHRCLARHIGLVLAIAAAGGGLLVSPARADILTVGPGAGFDYQRIQDAINAAASGDTIDVAPGVYVEGTMTYRGNGELTGLNFQQKTNITLRGAGADRTTIDLNLRTYGLMLDASQNVAISGVALFNSGGHLINVFNGAASNNISYTVLDFRGTFTGTIEDHYGGLNYNHATFVDTLPGGAFFGGGSVPSVDVAVSDSIFVNANRLNDASGQLNLHLDHVNLFQVSNPNYSTGSNITMLDPLFVDAAGGDFHLQAGSPLRFLASDGTYLGALDVAAVPEPTSLVLAGLGAAALGFRAWRRHRAARSVEPAQG